MRVYIAAGAVAEASSAIRVMEFDGALTSTDGFNGVVLILWGADGNGNMIGVECAVVPVENADNVMWLVRMCTRRVEICSTLTL